MREHLNTRAADGRSVTLRPLKPEDAPRVQQACSDPETVKWLGSDIINEQYSLVHAHGFIERALSRVAAGTHMSWGVTDTATDGLLGHISLIGSGGELTDTASLGYWAHPETRGTGITTAAAVAVVNEALTPTADGSSGLRRLTLRVAVGNVGSQRVAEAAGFVRTGHTRQSDPLLDGTFTDEFTYDLLATDPHQLHPHPHESPDCGNADVQVPGDSPVGVSRLPEPASALRRADRGTTGAAAAVQSLNVPHIADGSIAVN